MAKTKRSRPSVKDMEQGVEHSYDHRGETGMYGNFFTEDVQEWVPASTEHDIAIVMFYSDCEDNSVFRKSNPDLNKPFTDKQLKGGQTWAHKLSVFTHRNVGANKETIICLKTVKEACPICEEQARLHDTMEDMKVRNQNTDEIKKRADSLYPSKRAIYNIVCFDSKKERDKGIQIWTAPHVSIEDVLAAKAKDRRTGEITAFGLLEEGINVFFEKKGTGLNTEYIDVDLVDRRAEDELSEEEIDELYDSTNDLEAIIEVKTYNDIADMCKFGDNGGEQQEEESRGRQRVVSKRVEEVLEEEEKGETGVRRPTTRREKSTSSRGARGSTSDTQATSTRQLRSRVKEDDVEEVTDVENEKRPECFGVEFNTLQDCEDKCSEAMYGSCYEESERVKKEQPARVSRSPRAGRK